jgi:hypothetical protein
VTFGEYRIEELWEDSLMQSWKTAVGILPNPVKMKSITEKVVGGEGHESSKRARRAWRKDFIVLCAMSISDTLLFSVPDVQRGMKLSPW